VEALLGSAQVLVEVVEGADTVIRPRVSVRWVGGGQKWQVAGQVEDLVGEKWHRFGSGEEGMEFFAG
jgi:hypothetical protein